MTHTPIQYEFIKQNSEPVPIEYVEDEHEESRDFQPSFWWNNRRYFLDDFIRCHNNPWIGCTEYPEHIHAFESDNYHNPLFLELINDEEINIYLEREERRREIEERQHQSGFYTFQDKLWNMRNER